MRRAFPILLILLVPTEFSICIRWAELSANLSHSHNNSFQMCLDLGCMWLWLWSWLLSRLLWETSFWTYGLPPRTSYRTYTWLWINLKNNADFCLKNGFIKCLLVSDSSWHLCKKILLEKIQWPFWYVQLAKLKSNPQKPWLFQKIYTEVNQFNTKSSFC